MLKKLLAGLLSGLVAALLPACDGVNLGKLKPGITTAQQVREIMGPPTMQWADDDGTQTWEYPRTPNGVVNYMLDFGPDGVLRAVRQVLTAENLARVTPGMTREQIRRLLGQPAHVYEFSLKSEEVWDWRREDVPGTVSYFNVHFDPQGRVTHTSSNIEPQR